ncbi:protein argonaute 4a-like, partial [Trifolium medium]|nr:protein argonaute 4a-like [Trifolium medium]
MESSLINKPMRKTSNSNLLPMARKGLGSKGSKIQLLANHFRVGLNISDNYFYHYNVALYFQDGTPVEAKGIGRKVMDKLCETYDVLRNKNFAYDGEK